MSGNLKHGSIPTFPEDSIQNFIEPWWEEDSSTEIEPGRLIMAFLPHVDQQPYVVTSIGRKEATRHTEILVRIEALNVNRPQRKNKIPVAAMPSYGNEVTAAYRSKRRPAVVICNGGKVVDNSLRLGKPKWQTAPTIIVAPFYGADEDATRAGFPKELAQRVQHCEYPQFILDRLPISGSTESMLRLDHLQPLGFHYSAMELTQWKLNMDALLAVYDWIEWLFKGTIPDDCILKDALEYFHSHREAGC